jgi:hypothetical protein
VQVGLGFTSNLSTLNLEANVPGGTLQGKKTRIVRATARLHNTVGGKIGRDADNLDPIPGRLSSGTMDDPVQPFSGDKHVPFSGEYSDDSSIYIRQDQPLPMTVLGVMPEVATGARS